MRQIHLLLLLALSIFFFGCTSIFEEKDFSYAKLKITSVEVTGDRINVEASFQYKNIDISNCKLYVFTINDTDLATSAEGIDLIKRSESNLNEYSSESLSTFLEDNTLSFYMEGFEQDVKKHLYLVIAAGDYQIGSQKLADSEIVPFAIGKLPPTFAEQGKINCSNLTMTSAQLSTAISSIGGGSITACGFCYATSPNPTTAQSKVTVNSYTSFSATLSGLQSGTTYYARAFATNIVGTSYSKEVSFVIPKSYVEMIEMVDIPAGTFTMGSPTTEVDRSSGETQHQVTLSAFKMGKYEVTQSLWKAVMGGANPSYFQGDNLPVEMVSWDDVQLFLKELNHSTGKNYSLPTEAEWEYACRAGTTSPFHTGSCLTDYQANYWWGGDSLRQLQQYKYDISG